jgi:tetratricopeptide (TPR) repeat protein
MRRHRESLGVWCLLVTWAAVSASSQDLDEARRLHGLGRYREAVEAYRHVAESLAVEDAAAAAAARNNACVILNSLGDYAAAREECGEALRLRRELADDRGMARTLNNFALVLQNAGEYEAARSAFSQALAINERRGDVEAQVLNLANLGALATIAGEYGPALTFHGRAAALVERHANEPWAQEQRRITAINRGVVLERLGAYREALDLYRDLLADAPAAEDSRDRAQLLLNLGVVYRNLGDPARALESFQEVATIYRNLEDPDGLSNAMLNVALANHLDLGRWPEAEAAYLEALDLARRHGNRPEEIQDLFYLGEFLRESGRLDEAREHFEACLELAVASGSAEGRWSALAGLGRIAAEGGDLESAFELLSTAVDAIETAGSGISRDRLAGFFGDKRSVYAAAVQTLAALAAREPSSEFGEKALEIVQQAKARDLLDALGEESWPAKPLAGAELRGAAAGGAILEFFAAEQDLVRWAITTSSIAIANLGPRAAIEEDVLRVARGLARGSAPSAEQLARLSRRLLGGLDAEVMAGSRITVAPDGALKRFPFEVLAFEDSPQTPVVERLAVDYVASASTLAWLRERRGEASSRAGERLRLRGFGAPDLTSSEADPGSPRGLVAARWELEPLPQAVRELEALGRLLGGRHEILSGPEATEGAFRAAASSPAVVVHFATHAVIDERPGRGAAIVLGASGEDDGLLEPREIVSLEQDTILTVLAACRTAVDARPTGALSSLAGAFLAAGSSAVIATLWDVGDRATAVFMEQFYYQLGRGHRPAAALSLAKRRLRADPRWNRPEVWAAYVLIGDSPPVAEQPRAAAVVSVIALAAVLLGVAALYALRSTGP